MNRSRVRTTSTLLVACLGLMAPATLLSNVAGAATAVGDDAGKRVIVVLRTSARPAGRGAAAQRRHSALMHRDEQGAASAVVAAGGRIRFRYSLIDGFAATVSPTEALALARRSDVAAVIPDTLVRLRAPAVSSQAPSATHAGQGGARRGHTRVVTAPSSTPGTPAAPQPLPALTPTVCPSDPANPLIEPEGLSLIRAASNDPDVASASDYATGAGVRVGIIANAFDPNNPDLRRNGASVITSYKDFAGSGTSAPGYTTEAMGDAATVAAQGNKVYDVSAVDDGVPSGCTIKVRGVAPGADIVALKALDGQTFYSSVVAEAIDYAVTTAHVDVLNESLAGDAYPDTGDDPIALANAAAVAAGVTVTTATGDSGAGATIGAPASQLPGSAGVLTMGGSTQLTIEKQLGYYRASRTVFSGDIANLSSTGVAQTGRSPDALAPGHFGWSICTPDAARFPDCPQYSGSASGLQTFGGTSESAPMAAGVAALVIQRYRATHHGASPSPRVVKLIMTSTADDIGAPGEEQGSGQIDALRAVQLAGAIDDGDDPSATADVVAAPSDRVEVVGAGAHTATSITLTNPSTRTRHLRVAHRESSLVSTRRASTTLSDEFGTVPFSVKPGTDRLEIVANVPSGDTDYPDLVLIDPNGNVANESGRQGTTNTLRLEADHPLAGDWQLFIISSAYDGPASAVIRSYATQSVPIADITVPARSTRRVAVPVDAPAEPGDSTFAATVSDADSGAVLTSTPIVIRTLVDTSSGSFLGKLEGGNGRFGYLAGSKTYVVPVPAGTASLSVALHLSHPGQRVDAYLMSPSGSALDESSNLPPDTTDPQSGQAEIDLSAVRPEAGQWQLIFGVNGSLGGTRTHLGYRGVVSLASPPITVTGLPESTSNSLPAGVARHVRVHIVNDSSVPHAYVIDPRLSRYAAVSLSGTASVQYGPDNESPAGTTTVPPETREVTATMTADHAIAGTFAPQEISFDGFNGDPEVYQVSPSGRLQIDVRAPQLQSGPWLELPIVAGPFGRTGSGPVDIALQASAYTRAFDPDVSSSTGDPWPATIGAGQTVTPLVIPAHHSADLAVTITPGPHTGQVVRGTMYVDDWNGQTKTSGEVVGFPYAYRVG